MVPIARDEDGLATILGHEVAHLIARNGCGRTSEQPMAPMGKAGAFEDYGLTTRCGTALERTVFAGGTTVGVDPSGLLVTEGVRRS